MEARVLSTLSTVLPALSRTVRRSVAALRASARSWLNWLSGLSSTSWTLLAVVSNCSRVVQRFLRLPALTSSRVRGSVSSLRFARTGVRPLSWSMPAFSSVMPVWRSSTMLVRQKAGPLDDADEAGRAVHRQVIGLLDGIRGLGGALEVQEDVAHGRLLGHDCGVLGNAVAVGDADADPDARFLGQRGGDADDVPARAGRRG